MARKEPEILNGVYIMPNQFPIPTALCATSASAVRATYSIHRRTECTHALTLPPSLPLILSLSVCVRVRSTQA